MSLFSWFIVLKLLREEFKIESGQPQTIWTRYQNGNLLDEGTDLTITAKEVSFEVFIGISVTFITDSNCISIFIYILMMDSELF